jgi:ATP-dependent Clp protease ATP-binding subunit ClpC
MADGICDVCNVRPATVRARVSSNGQSEILELCDVDYRRLARQQQRPSSPLESLFGGRGSLFGISSMMISSAAAPAGAMTPRRSPRPEREAHPSRSGPGVAADADAAPGSPKA